MHRYILIFISCLEGSLITHRGLKCLVDLYFLTNMLIWKVSLTHYWGCRIYSCNNELKPNAGWQGYAVCVVSQLQVVHCMALCAVVQELQYLRCRVKALFLSQMLENYICCSQTCTKRGKLCASQVSDLLLKQLTSRYPWHVAWFGMRKSGHHWVKNSKSDMPSWSVYAIILAPNSNIKI